MGSLCETFNLGQVFGPGPFSHIRISRWLRQAPSTNPVPYLTLFLHSGGSVLGTPPEVDFPSLETFILSPSFGTNRRLQVRRNGDQPQGYTLTRYRLVQEVRGPAPEDWKRCSAIRYRRPLCRYPTGHGSRLYSSLRRGQGRRRFLGGYWQGLATSLAKLRFCLSSEVL